MHRPLLGDLYQVDPVAWRRQTVFSVTSPSTLNNDVVRQTIILYYYGIQHDEEPKAFLREKANLSSQVSDIEK